MKIVNCKISDKSTVNESKKDFNENRFKKFRQIEGERERERKIFPVAITHYRESLIINAKLIK